jgi:DNA-binding GntR family transcriptional regulator
MPQEPPPFGFALAREAFDTFGTLHADATLRGVPLVGDDGVEALREADAACRAALQEGRVEDAIDADDRFHDVFVRAAGDPDLEVGVALVRPRIRRLDRWYFARMAYDPDRSVSANAEIIAACEACNAEEAARLVEHSFREGGARIAEAVRRSAPG